VNTLPASSSRRASPDEVGLRRDQSLWLLAAALLTLAPHWADLPAWISTFCVSLLAWRLWQLWRGQAAASRWLLLALMLAAAIGVRWSFGHFLGAAPGLAFLAVLLSLKLLETRNMRDARVALLLCFFLQFGLFFNGQAASSAVFALIPALAALGSLVSLADPASGARERLKTSALLFVHGLPFMVALFIFFPRAAAPLWSMPSKAAAASGLSDSMEPGTISKLTLSDELAFTVEFYGPPPPPSERYWRGPVLSRFDGRLWRMTSSSLLDRPVYAPAGRRYDYRIMLEPHNRHWLPMLDYPAGPVRGVRFTRDFQALSRFPVSHRMQFDLSAFPRAMAGRDEHPARLGLFRQLPIHGNPKARALAAALKAETPEQTVARILAWLIEGEFVYTLQPPLLDKDSIDLFLFDTRMGFCEHFAAAFVFLARAAEVPARVVTGYQGGRINPVNETMSVRQSDAHAWAEVWLAGRGWVRVDPTALVAPRRIEEGLEASLPASDMLPFMLQPQYLWLRQLRDHWEAAATEWNRRVIAYDSRRQNDLLRLVFGLDASSLPAVLGATAIAIALLMAAFYYWAQRRRNALDPLDRAWARFSAKLARHGLARAPSEGPLDYARRLAAARPESAAALIAICTRYARLRYRPSVPHEEHKEICKLIHSVACLDLKKEPSPPP
jgi:transglutaminase-like putative cysteine protease